MRLLLLTLLLTPALQAQKPVAVVELFTSQGCSSCPPADALLATLTSPTHLVLTLSEHVTYWNSLGWRDPFSADVFTQRQSTYATRLHQPDVYTPQAVINGTTQVLGSDPTAITQAIAAIPTSSAQIQIASARLEGPHLQIAFTTTKLPANAHLYAVIADDRTSTHVPRGENGGRTLTEVTVARTFTEIPNTAQATAKATLDLPPGTQPRHLILIAQSPNQGAILTAASTPF